MKKIILAATLAMIISGGASVSGVKAVNVQTNVQAQAGLSVQAEALKNQLSQLPAEQQALIVRNLWQGLKGDDIKVLQAILAADASIYSEGLVTGFFGPATTKAVAKFQAKHGIKATGFVGPLTLAKIKAEFKDKVGLEADASGVKRPCAKVPPGHLIAKGWLRKHDGVRPIVPSCQNLPSGILDKVNRVEGSAVISAVAAANISSNGATINWMTNEAATTKVYYSTTSPLNLSTALNVSANGMVTAHSVNLVNLSANTRYYFVVESRDAEGNVSVSAEGSFTTSAS